MGGDRAQGEGGDANARHAMRWRLVLLIYSFGILADIGWHIWLYLTTGDRDLDSYELVIGLQASLFWPLDLLAQAALALR